MSVYGPGKTFLIVGGKDISSDTHEMEEQIEQVIEEARGFGEDWERSLPVGLGKITLSASGGFYDDRTAGINEALQGQGTTQQVVAYGFSGWDPGASSVQLDGAFAAIWKRIAQRAGLTRANAEYVINSVYKFAQVVSGRVARITDPFDTRSTPADSYANPVLGSVDIVSSSVANPTHIITATPHGLATNDVIVISGHTSVTPDINGGNGYAVTVVNATEFTIPVNVTDDGVGGILKKVSSVGAKLFAHCTALTLDGHTALRITPVHSVDNSSYVTLVSAFTDFTVAGVVASKVSGAQVHRFVAIDGDWQGAGGASRSAVVFVDISR